MNRTYPAVRLRQTASSGDLVLFSAPATDIDHWSGVPQRERLGTNTEAIGFQREESPKRLQELASFFGNPKNVIQNPLLCASRDSARVVFEPSDAEAETSAGVLTIEWDDLRELRLVELLRRVRTSLEQRLPDLAQTKVSVDKLARLKERANIDHPDVGVIGSDVEVETSTGLSLDEEPEGDESAQPATSVLFSGETHIADFWEEVAARVQLLEESGSDFDGDNFLGFSKDAMISYLQPVVVVDGQHRLRGAILAAEYAVNSDALQTEVETAIESGRDADEIVQELRQREARLLPVSMLMESAPAEHVFQFVVVNQKATPIGRALLGTIVSTSLSSDELAGVSERLEAAGIPLEDSQAIAYLTRHPDSPFKDLVEKGLTNEGRPDLLQWNVLGALVKIFRELKGGRLFGEKVDYADKWRRNHLDASGIVADAPPEQQKFEYWSRQDGPWRDVFIAFWEAVRDRLATTEDKDAGNYWGSPRNSNIFNKITLTILAADFFQYITDTRRSIDTLEDVRDYVAEWLDEVKTTYFSRDWKLGGIKKDAPGTRAQWAYLWVQYRKDPQQLPDVRTFRHQKVV
ncbi:hypothetical protein A5784_14800 [Mycobacterium sp. 852013-50091_SCH5140682]|uniref:hypothetical protein n=1 Tax=Mycobacterium sp. 852013-50091_SCH5140682 TaxID=1834109 RepID=UPI0007EAE29C|nr:hypothetical protein [Mycobacterium sp. 852013-50091_SCH5140682]OBC03473.1 hypothetical protein A5784_14800 [Mycobacterium sp. 852013-50091_SCH5140682]